MKFRAWDKEEKKWYAPIHRAHEGKLFELLINFSGELTMHNIEGLFHESLFPERFILMQYTGLKDKNGKEIYEGDIVKHSDYTEPLKVYFDDCAQFRLQLRNCGNNEPINSFEDEVVDNIYENPEYGSSSSKTIS
ncbi:MAG: hypothetical protein HYZ54_13675 [Ignavibacteriae bacterium]|nr:hypothetical protein [Ignavibacteriota bacterium]